MTTTPASTSLRVWSAAIGRLRSTAGWIARLSGTRLLHAAAVTVTTAVAALSMVEAATCLYSVAVRHEASPSGAVMFTAAVLGLYTAITASAWSASLHGRELPRVTWVLWWFTVGVGLAATAGTAGADTWVARGINAAPMAALAAVTGLVTHLTRP